MNEQGSVNQDAKTPVRRQLRAARKDLGPAELATRAERLAQYLGEVIPEGSAVAGYLPMPGEPDLRPFLRVHADRGGIVYLPVVTDPLGRVLEWVNWTQETVLQRSTFLPVDEPVGDRLSTAELRARYEGRLAQDRRPAGPEQDQRLTVLVPGLAVDDDGARLGQGGGFYDTAFGPAEDSLSPGAPAVPAVSADQHLIPTRPIRFIAVVHASEVLAPGSFPVEPHDLRVDAIVTERGATQIRPL